VDENGGFVTAVVLTVIVVVLAAIAAGLFVLRRRIDAGAQAKAHSKALAAAALAEGRLRGELDYVLSRIDAEIERLASAGAATGLVAGADDAKMIPRLQELRDVLRQTLVARKEPFPLSGPCAELIDQLREGAGERDLLYNETGDGRWLHVQGDRELIRWALAELFANTAHHAGNWTRVSILAEPVEGGVRLTFRDDGQGLLPSVAARLYSPFTARFRSPGPGIGLYAVRVIIERAGGSVESGTAPGQGLVHRLRLPHPPSGHYGAAATTPHHAAAPRGAHSQ
jgi:signal transduction histidine kinase